MKIKKRSEHQLNQNVRWQALKIIHQIEYENEFSNVLVDKSLQYSKLNEQDKRLLVQLVYGVVQRRLTLNYYLEPFIHDKKMDTWVESLLRLSVFQLVYLDKVPSHAIVNEAVNIAKINGHDGLGKFVNAILRQFERYELRELPDQATNEIDYLSVKYSMPAWLVKELTTWLNHDEIQTESLLASLLDNPKLSLRIVGHPDDREQVQKDLLADGIETSLSNVSPYGLIVEQGNVFESNSFKQGKVTVQDESSMLVAPIGKLTGSEQVLDACAAPGGKATHIAQILNDGHLTALDLTENKIAIVNDHLERMNLSDKVTTLIADATKYVSKSNQLYDTIYLDAPCSGLGLMRRKPEIKYQKQPQDLVDLSRIQLEILTHVATLLKPGGVLVYSTCTLGTIENEQLIEQFLANHKDFILDPINQGEISQSTFINENGQVRVWPHQFHTDGFFISRLIKK